MSMSFWAENECRIACKKENADFDFDSNDFDYGCSCYKSALKAYKSLMEDGHSGMSFGFTKNILIRLMEGLPLTPITDEDFFKGKNLACLESDEYLKEHGLKSDIQCPRMSSLFRKETLDGKVTYHDVDRAYFVNIEEPSDTYGANDSFLDEMFPITMPYVPQKEKYKIYAQTFLANEKNGDYDTRGIYYVITPEGERIDVNLFYTEINGKWEQISEMFYMHLLNKRIDTTDKIIADNLIWTLFYNSAPNENESEMRKDVYDSRSKELKTKDFEELRKLCVFFNNKDNWKYNTFQMRQALCTGENKELYKNVKELNAIADYLSALLKEVMNNV